MAAKRRKDDSTGARSPLDAKQRALAETEAKLRAEMERCQKTIEDAPKQAQERRKKLRDEIINRASRTELRTGSRAALPDRRQYEFKAAIPMRSGSLRSERRQGRLTFFALLLLLAVVAVWLYYTVTQS